MSYGRNRGAAWRNRNQTADVWNDVMNKDNGFFGIIVGGIVAVAAAIFIFSGGELGGKKTIEGDEDLPPIAAADQN
jgi:hypothetical protein